MAESNGNADEAGAGVTAPTPHDDLTAPETLISRTIGTLRNTEGTDVALLDILARHILTMNPAATAIADAMTAIEALAAKRAEESDDGNAGHD